MPPISSKTSRSSSSQKSLLFRPVQIDNKENKNKQEEEALDQLGSLQPRNQLGVSQLRSRLGSSQLDFSSFQLDTKYKTRRRKLSESRSNLFVGVESNLNKLYTQLRRNPSLVSYLFDLDEPNNSIDISQNSTNLPISQDPTEITSYIASVKEKKTSSCSQKKARLVNPSQATTMDNIGEVEVVKFRIYYNAFFEKQSQETTFYTRQH